MIFSYGLSEITKVQTAINNIAKLSPSPSKTGQAECNMQPQGKLAIAS